MIGDAGVGNGKLAHSYESTYRQARRANPFPA